MKMDILIPSQFEKDWTNRVSPALEALGLPKDTTLEDSMGDLKKARIWPMSIQRPTPGSVVMARGKGGVLHAGDLQVHMNEDQIEWGPRELLVRVKSVYGQTLQAVVAETSCKENVELEGHELLVISTDFITFLADVLPEKDAFVVVGMWPTSTLPLFILTQQNLSYTSRLSLNSFRWIKEGEVEFLVMCSKCNGAGQLICKKCEGSGEWQPDGNCNKCGGSGELTCRRCDGSGDFIGKYGDRMGDCNSCSGIGVKTCFKCNGSGEPPVLSCNDCDGNGYRTCRKCSGKKVNHVPFMHRIGCYGYSNQLFSACDVSGWDERKNADYQLDREARNTLEELINEFGVHVGRQKKIHEVKDEISKISHCLDRAMEVEGITEEILNFRSPPLGLPMPTTDRMKHRLVLAFPLLKLPSWAKTGDCPLPPNSPVQLLDNPTTRTEIEIPRSRSKGLIEPARPVFVRMEILEDRPHLLISLPNDVVVDKLPAKLFIKPDVPPPSELAQKKELVRWCSPEGAPKLLETLAINPGENKKPPEVVTSNKFINPSQQKALNWIMGGLPLVLVKGPPGTGKTTVITEAVLQSIKRNEKVLVCSETHQAVENVLERLHKDGGIRMIRHGRADQHQLSSLGREYLEESSKQIFVRSVMDRVAKYVACRKSESCSLETLDSKFSQAHAAAIQLADERQRLSDREQKARKEYQQIVQTAKQEAEVACRAAEESANSLLSKLETEIDEAKVELDRQKKSFESSKSRKDVAKAHFLQKMGRDPDPHYSGSTSLLRKFASLGTNKLASADHLNERFVAATAAMMHSKHEIERLDQIVESSRLKQENCCSTRDEKIGQSKAQSADQSRRAEADLDQLLQGISTESKTAELRFLPAQKQAVETNESFGIFPSWEADVSPEIWHGRITQCYDRISRNKEKLEFCTRWHSAAENASAALTALFWDTAQVFLSTCVGLASWRSFAQQFGSEGVDLVIIDESAHATLTQSLIPMGRAKRTVLIGDEMQLPPAAPMGLTDKCEHSCEACVCSVPPNLGMTAFKPNMSSCWLERSAFEWIAETRPWVPRVMLNKQFRMHPDIADFVAQVFYEEGLENGVKAVDRHLNFGSFNKAVCLIPTSAYKDRFEDKARGATSYRNPLETHLTKRILEQAKSDLDSDTSFGVLTPYSAQKELMSQELVGFFDDGGHLKFKPEDIASVDSFQGSERDVMIASFVRSPKKAPRKCKVCKGTGKDDCADCAKCKGSGWLGAKLNWVHDLRRLNVAFSRARKMLILVGDIEALTDQKIGTKQGTDVLERFRDYIMDRGRVLHVWEKESHE